MMKGQKNLKIDSRYLDLLGFLGYLYGSEGEASEQGFLALARQYIAEKSNGNPLERAHALTLQEHVKLIEEG